MNHPEIADRRSAVRMNVLVDQRGDTSEHQVTPIAIEYLRIAKRRKFVIAGTILGFLLAGLILTLLMTPKYTAVTQVEIARESNKIVNLQGVEQEASDADQEFYQTQFGLLRSRSLAERVATKLRLNDDPAFFEMFGVDLEDYGGRRAENNRFPAAERGLRTRLAGEVLLENVAIDPTRLSRLVNISVTTPDATLSANIANAWAENFIQATLERRYEATSYARQFLESRLEQLRRRLEDSERRLVSYASNQRIINLPTTGGPSDSRAERSIVAENLASLNAELNKATGDRVKAEARYDQLRTRAGASPEALENGAINSLRAKRAELAADYEKLSTQFEPGYPAALALKAQIDQLDRSLTNEERRVSGSIGSEYKGAFEREQELSRRVESLKVGLLDLRRRSIQYNIYQREVDTNRALYDGLLQRYKEIGITGGVGVNNIAIVDTAATPDRQSSPKLILNILLSLILGTFVGAGLALLLEHVDESIMDPADVRQRLGLPLLGTVPRTQDGDPTEALRDRKSELFDAYLAIQANLALATNHGMPRTLAVTSTRPAEGKSTSALSLATTLVRSGRSVVLIDGDMRSPSIHHLLSSELESGLSNYLAGDDNLDGLLVKAEQYGFTAMTAGPLPPNAAELLTSDRLERLLEKLLAKFDNVVIDSPPVMGLADAPLIGSRVEGVIFVVESQGVRARLVRTAVERLTSGGAHIIGTVLTKFDARRAHVGHGYEYGYDYGRKATAKA